MAEEQEEQTSKYSSGVNIIKRLDTLWIDTHTHSRAGKYMLWNSDLDRIWLELARDLKEKKYDSTLKNFNETDEELTKFANFNDHPPEGFGEVTPEMITQRNKIYQLLMKKQLFLARLENKLGKGTTFADDDEDDFD